MFGRRALVGTSRAAAFLIPRRVVAWADRGWRPDSRGFDALTVAAQCRTRPCGPTGFHHLRPGMRAFHTAMRTGALQRLGRLDAFQLWNRSIPGASPASCRVPNLASLIESIIRSVGGISHAPKCRPGRGRQRCVHVLTVLRSSGRKCLRSAKKQNGLDRAFEQSCICRKRRPSRCRLSCPNRMPNCGA